jgi:DNA-binding beta-propeller fold protein YncE
MTSPSRIAKSTFSAFTSCCDFSHALKLGRRAALCAVLFLLSGGASNMFAASNGFNSAQRVLGSGFTQPMGIAVDRSGNVFVADNGNLAVKEILAQGGYITVNTLGSGFVDPSDVAVDGNGNVFVADLAGGVKEILAAGGYTTVNTLGSGFVDPSGVAVDGNGNVFVADPGAHSVDEIVAVNGSIPASPTIRTLSSIFSFPTGVAVDENGNVFVADFGANLVKVILAVGGSIPATPTINTLASGFVNPLDVAVDGSGNIFVAEYNGADVKEILAAGGYNTVKTVAAGLDNPLGLALDSSGTLYVADTNNSKVWQYMWTSVNFVSQAVGTTSTTVTMNFTIPASTTIGSVAVLTLGNKNMDFADAGGSTCTTGTYATMTNCVVTVNFKPQAPGLRRGAFVVYDSTGSQLGSWRMYGIGLGPQVAFNAVKAPAAPSDPSLTNAMRIQADAKGNLFAAVWGDANNDPNTGTVMKFGYNGSGYDAGVAIASGLAQPVDLAIDGAGNVFVLSVADGNNDNNSGAVLGILKTTTGYAAPITVQSGFNYPWGMALDSSEDVYLALPNAGQSPGQIFELPASGGGIGGPVLVASGLTKVMGLALDGSGNLFAVLYRDASNDPNSGSLVALPKTASGFGAPVKLATGLSYPAGVTVDSNGNALVASVMDSSGDTGTGAILEIPFTGTSFGPPVTLASGMTFPQGVALDSWGNIFFPDQGTSEQGPSSSMVLELPRATAPSLSFASTVFGQTSTDSPQPVMVANIGNQPLDFTSVAYPADFPEDASGEATDCAAATPLAANSTCTATIDFTPGAVGNPLSESLVLTDNALNAAGPNYATQSIALSGIATPATPAITWAAPAAIAYGTALSDTQLSASSMVAGKFTYTPAAGTVLGAGPQTLKVVFTPTDGTDYTTATTTVQLTVTKVALTVTANDQTMSYGGTIPALTGTLTGVVTGDGITASYATTATSSSAAGTYPITATLNDPNSKLGNYTVTNTAGTLTIGMVTPALTWATPAAIVYGTKLSATQLNASSKVAGSFTYSPAAGTVLSAGPATLSVTFTPTDTTDYTTATATVKLTVNQAAPANTLTSSANPAFLLNAVTFTATVSSSGGTPGGTVSFYDGTTLLGQGTLSSGVATYSTSALAAGAHTITAAYSGDTDFSAVTSSALTETIEDFTVSWLSSGVTTLIAPPGGQAVYSLTLSPPSGTTFPAPITFSVTGLPAGATATFSPATIAAGAGTTTVTMTVTLASQSAVKPLGRPFGGGALPVALGLILLPFAGRMRRAPWRWSGMVFLIALSLTLAAGVTGCGGSSSSGSSPTPSTTPKGYLLTITATSGSLSHSTVVNLTVE